jgi:hypothetical protein
MKDVIPPLPEPDITSKAHIDPRYDTRYYTEAKLLAHREAVIEMCAEKAEDDESENGYRIAKNIRSLK